MTTQNPAPPPELSDQQIAELSPADREQYFHDRAVAGVNDDGFFGWARRMHAGMQAEGRADQASQDNVRDLSSSGDVEFVQGLNPSDANYQGHEHAQMSQYVVQNLDANQVGEVSDAYFKLHTAFKDFATELKDAVGKSEHEWEGEAASDARNYFTSLQTWSDGNSTNAKLASETMYQQSEAATSAKNRMPEEIPFNWESEMDKWGDNPLDLVGNINKSMETYRASNEAQAEAAGVMAQYDNDLFTAASKQPVFAEPPKFGVGSDSYGVNMPKPEENSTSASGFVGGPAGVAGGSIPGSSIPSGGGGMASIPGVGSGGGSGNYAPESGPPLTRGSSTGTGSVTPVGDTRASGYQRPNFNPSRQGRGGGSNHPGMTGMGAMPMGGMGPMGGGGGGGADYNSKIGRGGGGFGPGGSSAGAGGSASGSANGPASGSASGAAKPGGLGAAETAGRSGSTGATGGRGMAGGMGGGRGGQGGEDEEHQRPTYLVEADPDAVFGTDQRTAPPVIGE